jgi:hypothetical protein
MSSWTSLEPATVPVEPGESALAKLTVRNDGDTVSEYGFTVVGAPAAWTRLEPATLRLYPGARGIVTVTLAPPRSPEAPAGPSAYGIRVRSRQNPALFDLAEGRVTVGAFSEVRTELYPLTARGRLSASPQLRVENAGNAPLDAVVSARDDEDALRFRPTPPAVQVPPGGSAATRLRIQPRGLRLLRREQRLPYAVTTRLSGPGTETFASRLESRGTFVHRPLLPRWLFALAVAVVALALLSTGLYYASRALRNNTSTVAAPSPAATQASQNTQNSQPPATQQSTGNGQGDGGSQNNGASDPVVISGARVGDLLTRADNDDVGLVRRQNQSAPDSQRWLALPAGDNTVVLVPAGETSKALKQDDDKVQLDDLDRQNVGNTQKWRVDNKGNNRFQITNVDSGNCLTDQGTNKQVTAADCQQNLENQQRWLLLKN